MSELNRMEIIASLEQSEVVTAILTLSVNHGWEEEDLPGGEILFRLHTHNPQFFVELEASLKANLPGLDVSTDMIPELDWVESWKEFFTPVEAGSRFIVLAPWMEEEKAATSRMPIIIEPKTAFGTGHHATTSLCLDAISSLFDADKIKAGDGFLDLGTGSGILGIAAAKLGLSGIGVDPDIMSVENALENREINGVSADAFVVRRGSIEAVDGGPFELCLANILAEPLLNLAAPLSAKVKSGGCLVLSGILKSQAETVKAAYSALGEPVTFTRDEWACLVWS
ncbi:50S ribosomal protein L11 methyltransferase [Desulfovibrio sp. OttesenSCG-928-C06]|nr:50S ribosomal protein L11 methyltransferase [Desulfovibrio sp. OttesenSCG-928-C06]